MITYLIIKNTKSSCCYCSSQSVYLASRSWVPGWGSLVFSINLPVSVSSLGQENEDMFDVMWCFATVGADVKTIILLDPTLIGTKDCPQYPGLIRSMVDVPS